VKYLGKEPFSVVLGGPAFRDHYEQTFGPRCYRCDGRKGLAVVESVELGGDVFEIHACRKCQRELRAISDRQRQEMERMMP